MPGWILMHAEAIRSLDYEGVPWGTSKEARLKGNEGRRKRQAGVCEQDE
jgi:hypothetical protein